MDFIVRLVEAVAWPAAAVWLGYLFRADLRALLNRVSHLKYGEAEAMFEVGVEKIGEDVPRLPPPKTQEELEPISIKERELFELSERSPRAAVLEAWLEVEREIAVAATKLQLPPNDMVAVLKHSDLTSEYVPTFQQLRALRNQAAHADAFSPNPEKVRAYVRQALFLALMVAVTLGAE